MDFKFHSMEERSSTNYYSFSSPSNDFPNRHNMSFYPHQAIQADISPSPTLMRRENHMNPNPVCFQRIQREVEKEKIRAEIIAGEVYRRKILEDEVRRELMLERQIAFSRGRTRDLGIGSSTMPFQSRVPWLMNSEHRIGGEVGFLSETMPFQRDPVFASNVNMTSTGNALPLGVKLKELKYLRGPVSATHDTDNIFLAEPNVSDLKRKATTAPTAPVADLSAGSKKPKTMEWSCSLCCITATSERGLNDHLRGKKHKTKVNELNSQITDFGSLPVPKTDQITDMPSKVSGISKNSSLKKQVDRQSGEISLGPLDNTPSKERPETKENITHLQVQTKSIVKGKNRKEASSRKATGRKPTKKPKFFCKTCQLEVQSLKVLNAHKKGKRHLAKVTMLGKSSEISAHEAAAETKMENKKIDTASMVEQYVVDEWKEANVAASETKMQTKKSETDSMVEHYVVDEWKEANVAASETKIENKKSDTASFVEQYVVDEWKEPNVIVAEETENEVEVKLEVIAVSDLKEKEDKSNNVLENIGDDLLVEADKE